MGRAVVAVLAAVAVLVVVVAVALGVVGAAEACGIAGVDTGAFVTGVMAVNVAGAGAQEVVGKEVEADLMGGMA